MKGGKAYRCPHCGYRLVPERTTKQPQGLVDDDMRRWIIAAHHVKPKPTDMQIALGMGITIPKLKEVRYSLNLPQSRGRQSLNKTKVTRTVRKKPAHRPTFRELALAALNRPEPAPRKPPPSWRCFPCGRLNKDTWRCTGCGHKNTWWLG